MRANLLFCGGKKYFYKVYTKIKDFYMVSLLVSANAHHPRPYMVGWCCQLPSATIGFSQISVAILLHFKSYCFNGENSISSVLINSSLSFVLIFIKHKSGRVVPPPWVTPVSIIAGLCILFVILYKFWTRLRAQERAKEQAAPTNYEHRCCYGDIPSTRRRRFQSRLWPSGSIKWCGP